MGIFISVKHTVAIGIGIERISTKQCLLGIGQVVAVGIFTHIFLLLDRIGRIFGDLEIQIVNGFLNRIFFTAPPHQFQHPIDQRPLFFGFFVDRGIDKVDLDIQSGFLVFKFFQLLQFFVLDRLDNIGGKRADLGFEQRNPVFNLLAFGNAVGQRLFQLTDGFRGFGDLFHQFLGFVAARRTNHLSDFRGFWSMAASFCLIKSLPCRNIFLRTAVSAVSVATGIFIVNGIDAVL